MSQCQSQEEKIRGKACSGTLTYSRKPLSKAHTLCCTLTTLENYKYDKYPEKYGSLPRMIAGLPPFSEAFDSLKSLRFAVRLLELISLTGIEESFEKIATKGKKWANIFSNAIYGDLLKSPPSNILHNWDNDEEFCQQLLQGMNPLVIAKVTPKTHITEELKKLTSNGKNVDQLISEGRLFILDYEILQDHKQRPKVFLYAPMVLLENTDSGLKILGIQLTRNNGILGIHLTRGAKNNFYVQFCSSSFCKHTYYLPPVIAENEVITPETAKTDPNRYLFAKMHVACADLQVHEFINHLGLTHLAMEPFAVAQHNVWDTKYETHKLGWLMKPHYKDTIAINYLARHTLIADGNPAIDNLALGAQEGLRMFSKKWKQWDFRGHSFPEELRSRGFTEDGSDNLKNYYFRDDGFKIWHAIKAYVVKVVHELFKDDESVKSDEAVQAWYKELTSPELADIQSFPKLNTREVLIESITTIIFTCSAQHSAINYSQYIYAGFVPNRPAALSKPMPPLKDSPVPETYISSALPEVSASKFQVEFTHILTLPPDPQEVMSELAVTRKEFPLAHASLVEDMKKISEYIQKRNELLTKEGKTPYPWMQPDKINMSIAI
ncbi:lipoxygenase [Endogone sp. FLAS-F59071]|nr:lipoxygenase [Endogone sp. FLAS-F59071]|eukprot:RUS22218.1 lipoxygenase [Endogone sp. FLAS-F59071]